MEPTMQTGSPATKDDETDEPTDQNSQSVLSVWDTSYCIDETSSQIPLHFLLQHKFLRSNQTAASHHPIHCIYFKKIIARESDSLHSALRNDFVLVIIEMFDHSRILLFRVGVIRTSNRFRSSAGIFLNTSAKSNTRSIPSRRHALHEE
jgi:hypothetical protein